jgi:hypothetical protein
MIANLSLSCKMRGREVVRQDLGQLRNLVATAKHEGHINEEDEEEFFRRIMNAWMQGILYEIRLVAGKEERLDKWHHKSL